ncbi:MAG TPA: hypothetical protein VGL59_25900, partial [Polyangia bacterium]
MEGNPISRAPAGGVRIQDGGRTTVAVIGAYRKTPSLAARFMMVAAGTRVANSRRMMRSSGLLLLCFGIVTGTEALA